MGPPLASAGAEGCTAHAGERAPRGPREPGWWQLARWLRDPHRFLDDCARRFGSAFTLDLSLLSHRTVVVSDPEHVREVFVAPHDVLSAGEASKDFQPFVGLGSLFLLDGAEHARHRRLMSPAFRAERMDAYFEVIVAAVERVAREWPRGEPVAFFDAARRMTLEALVQAVFGPRGAVALADFGGRAKEMVEICARPHLLVPAARVDLGRCSPWGRVVRTMGELDARIYAHMDALRDEGPNTRRDVLTMLLDASDEDGSMSRKELRDELVTLLLAGNETTAAALAWTMDELLRAPAELARVRTELRGVLGGGPLRREHLTKIGHLDACIREALRLHPPITNAIRCVKKPMRVGPWELMPGTEIAPCMYLTHRRSDLYPDPHAYRPERFVGHKVDAYSFYPFGGGSRRCMGMHLALYEVKVALAHLLSRWSFVLLERERPRARRRAVLMAPSSGIPLIASPLRGET